MNSHMNSWNVHNANDDMKIMFAEDMEFKYLMHNLVERFGFQFGEVHLSVRIIINFSNKGSENEDQKIL